MKIGISDAPDERLDAHQASNPVPLEITELIEFRSREEALAAEQTVHAVLSAAGDQLRGEWFQSSPNVTQMRLLARRLQGSKKKRFLTFEGDLQPALRGLPLVRSESPDDWGKALTEGEPWK